MQIEVNVSEVDLSTVVGGSYDDGPTTLGDLVVAEITRQFMKTDDWRPLRDRIADIRNEVIREQITPMIEEAVSKPIQRTSTYGTPVGEPVPMREIVIEEARKVLQGIPGGSYGRDQQPIGRQIIHEQVDRTIRAELTKAIQDEREKVVAAVRAQAADLIAEAVTKGVAGR